MGRGPLGATLFVSLVQARRWCTTVRQFRIRDEAMYTVAVDSIARDMLKIRTYGKGLSELKVFITVFIFLTPAKIYLSRYDYERNVFILRSQKYLYFSYHL